MGGKAIIRDATPDEAKAFAAHLRSTVRDAAPDEAAAFEAEGGAEGGGGSDSATSKRLEPVEKHAMGGPSDFAKSWASSAALGGGPQIAGAMGAIANSATDPFNLNGSDADAYSSVRNDAAKEIAKSDDTWAGKAGKLLGVFSTPGLPKAVKGASIPARAWQGAKVGGTLGGLNAAFTSPSDLTKADIENLKRFLKDTGGGVVGGAVAGGLTGAGLAASERPLRNTAEEQALRAAGLEAGIKNKIQKDLGIQDMQGARALGREFLDEGLIPPVGSSEAVAARAKGLQGRAGQTIGAVMNNADVATMHTPSPPLRAGQTAAGRPANTTPPRPGFDYGAAADSAHEMLGKESAVADELSGAKARQLLEAFEKQNERTPGSFVGANQAKSDAWRSARFDQDAPMSAVLYRKAVGKLRDDIERQVGDALGPEAAQSLNSANQKYGVAADALKLAENASTRDAARKGFTTMDLLALLGPGGTMTAAGHPIAGGGVGLASLLGKKAFDKYGHSTAARFADFLAKGAAENTGGKVGGRGGAEAWAKLLGEDDSQ